jgi:hypothetical protein
MSDFQTIKDSYKRFLQGQGTQDQAQLEGWIELQMEKDPTKSRDYWISQWRKMRETPIKHKTQWEKDHPSADLPRSKKSDVTSSFNFLKAV